MKKNFNSISVVCPVYNSAKYIKNLCLSLLSQSNPIDEIIFIDDGSTDETVKLLNLEKNNFIFNNIIFKLITNKHLGPGNARNIGIENADYEWIAFLDSDDTWDSNKISEVKKIIDSENNINTILHYEKYITLKQQERILYNGINYNTNRDLFLQLYENNFFSTSALIFKKNLIMKYKFDISLPNAQDYDFWLKISDEINLYVIKQILGIYYQNNSSITYRPYFKRIISILRVYIRHRKKANNKMLLINIFKTIFSLQWFMDLKKII